MSTLLALSNVYFYIAPKKPSLKCHDRYTLIVENLDSYTRSRDIKEVRLPSGSRTCMLDVFQRKSDNEYILHAPCTPGMPILWRR